MSPKTTPLTIALLLGAVSVCDPANAGGGPPRADFGGTSHDFLLFQDQAAMPGLGGVDHHFGRALATCDFNGDGFEDLALGVPGETFGGAVDAGQVTVAYGSAAGILGDALVQSFRAGLLIPGTPEVNDRFGAALAAADFNLDGACDLAIGIPGDTVGGVVSGSVQVLYGDADLGGLWVEGNQLLNYDYTSVNGPAVLAEYGAALAAGDLDGNGVPDLAVGLPARSVGGQAAAGTVHVYYGVAAVGLQTLAPDDQFVTEADLGFASEAGDRFGAALAIGTFDPVAGPALAIGVPNENIAGLFPNAGQVYVVGGSPTGFDLSDVLLVGPNNPALPGEATTNDFFGFALAAGDLDGDGIDELAIGVPGRNGGEMVDRGEVLVAWGGAGFSGGFDGGAFSDASSAHSTGGSLGWSLAVRDTNGDGFAELASGAPGRLVSGNVSAGGVEVFGAPQRTTTWLGAVNQATNSPQTGVPVTNSVAGFAVAFGDFDGDGRADLVSGGPGAHIADDPGAGSVVVFAARGLFQDGFEAGNTTAWSATVP